MKRLLLPLLAASVLLSCSTAPKVDPLEAKAREGDPVAACQLAARSLHECALAREAWEASKQGPRPACMSEPVSEQQMSYLKKAEDKMRATDRLLFLTGPRIQLLAAHAILIAGPADKAVQAAVDVQRDCGKFADSMVD
jgi:hypothetical protein